MRGERLMASDYFLEIEGIKGESKDKKHKDMIDVESWSWGASQLDTVGTPGLKGEDLSFHHHIDKASPVLMLSCAQGKHIPKAVLYIRRSADDSGDYYKVTFEDVLISSFQHGGEGGGALPTEQVSMHYAKVDFAYAQVRRNVLDTYFETGDIPNQD
jgi:type VI secretion system secreted protein Hcp